MSDPARRLPFVDAMFLRLETSETPMHVGALQIFTIPQKAGPNFVREIVTALRAPGDLAEPFNLCLTGGRSRGSRRRTARSRRQTRTG